MINNNNNNTNISNTNKSVEEKTLNTLNFAMDNLSLDNAQSRKNDLEYKQQLKKLDWISFFIFIISFIVMFVILFLSYLSNSKCSDLANSLSELLKDYNIAKDNIVQLTNDNQLLKNNMIKLQNSIKENKTSLSNMSNNVDVMNNNFNKLENNFEHLKQLESNLRLKSLLGLDRFYPINKLPNKDDVVSKLRTLFGFENLSSTTDNSQFINDLESYANNIAEKNEVTLPSNVFRFLDHFSKISPSTYTPTEDNRMLFRSASDNNEYGLNDSHIRMITSLIENLQNC